MIETAKIFTNGGSQAVRLPKDCRFQASEVLVNRIGSMVMLIPKDTHWQNLLSSLDMFTDDFLSEEEELSVQKSKEVIT